MSDINLLDTTLRDGSYAVDFRFTCADTARICGGLEAAGLRYIEIGHGSGLRASECGLGRAAATDHAYLCAARDALREASFGMFCIPGIAVLDDVDMAADCGMGFIRIGTDVTRVPESEPFIALAKRRGLLVMTNFMKSYALPPKEFAREVRRSEAYGADVVYVVDSAGSMLPHESVEYFHAIREVSDVPVGFHGHNNLGLAVGNTLQMADAGAVFLDSSLQGLGRSAGNAMTEALVAALHRRGHRTGVDLLGTLRLGYRLVAPLVREGGILPLDLVAGFAGFHSSFLPKLLESAARHRVDPAQLMIEVCGVDRVQLRDEVLEEAAGRLCSGGAERNGGDYGEGAPAATEGAAVPGGVGLMRAGAAPRSWCSETFSADHHGQ
jgi:4-hydroxy 2-oxovalerate aldolase